jgi:hypothetical protein
MKVRSMVLAALAVAIVAGCGGSAQQGRVAEEESTGDSAAAAPTDSGGDGALTTTTTAGEEAPATPGEPQPMVTGSEEWDELLEADADLDASLELSEPDCGSASEHLERLCDLAERICEIAEDTGDRGARDRCSDGTARCERGRSAHADACD